MVSVAVPVSALSAMMAARRLPLPTPPSAKVVGVMEDRTVRSSRDSRSRKWTADRRLGLCRPRRSRVGLNLLNHIGCDCGSNIGATPFTHLVKNTSHGEVSHAPVRRHECLPGGAPRPFAGGHQPF